MPDPNVSLIVIARDEALNLPRCLASAAPAVDEMVVVDTGSEDATTLVAREFGARAYPFAWEDDFAAARNFARSMARGRWILVLDADEALGPGAAEAVARLATPWQEDGELPYYFGRVLHFTEPGCDPERAMIDYGKAILFPNHPGFRFLQPNYDYLDFAGPPGRAERRQAPELLVHDYGQTEPERRQQRAAQNVAITRRALERDPANDYLRFHHCRELHLAGDHAGALTQAYDLLNRNYPEPRFTPELLAMAAYYGAFGALHLEQPAAAALLSLEGICHCPLHTGLWQTLGGAYLWLQQSGEQAALLAVDMILGTAQLPPPMELDRPIPDEARRALFVVGYAHYVAQEYETALRYFLRACDYLLHQPMVPVMALLTALRLGRHAEGLALLERAAACYPAERERLAALTESFREAEAAPQQAERVVRLLDQWQQAWPPAAGAPASAAAQP